MSCWGLEQEDVHDRVLWHSLIELGASRMAIRKGYSRLGENSDKIENIPCTSLSFTDTCILWSLMSKYYKIQIGILIKDLVDAFITVLRALRVHS